MKYIFLFVCIIFANIGFSQAHTRKLQVKQALHQGHYSAEIIDSFYFLVNRLEEAPRIVEHIPGEIISYDVVSPNFAFASTFRIQENKLEEIQLKPSDTAFLSLLNTLAPVGKQFSYNARWGFGFVKEKDKNGVYTIYNHTSLFSSREFDIPDGPVTIELKYTTQDFKIFKLKAYRWDVKGAWIHL